MNINELLRKVDVEIARSVNDCKHNESKDNNKVMEDYIKVRGSFNNLRKIIGELESNSNFVEKMNIKKDIKDIIKLFKSKSHKEELKIQMIKYSIDKLNVKYELKAQEINKSNNIDKSSNFNSQDSENEEEYVRALKERISRTYEKVKADKEKNGIKNNKSVQVLSLSEIKEAAERSHKIEIAKAKADKARKRLIKQKKADEEVIGGITEKVKKIAHRNHVIGTSDMLNIRYELQNNNYYVNELLILNNPKKLNNISQKERFIRARLQRYDDFDNIFDKSNPKEINCLKNCDPYIVTILAKKDIKLAKDYVKKVAGTSAIKESDANYQITYDIRGIESVPKKELSLFDKLKLRKTIKYNSKALTVIEDKKKLPWYATIPVVGALAAATVYGGISAFNSSSDNNNEHTTENNSYSDSVEPGSTTNTNITSIDTTKEQTQTKTTASTTKKDPSNKNQQTTTTSKEAHEKEDQVQEEVVVINIGDKISVSEGLEYTSNCLGEGKSNKIGSVSWRPAADYSIDKVAFCYDGEVLGIMKAENGDVRKELNNYATQYGIDENDINTSVLLSLVPGVGDTGWAQISIDDMEKNISKPAQDMDSTSRADVTLEIER